MTFPSLLRCFFLSCLALASVAGCSPIPETPSWYHRGTVDQKPDISQSPDNSHERPIPKSEVFATSRLDDHPWPPGMGQPLPPGEAAHPPAAALSAGKVKVAILLPLSGKNAALGQAMLNAAQLAVFDAADKNFELMPRDTGPGGAAAATQDVIDDGARLVIGPVFASDVMDATQIVQSANINMLALSTDTTLADNNVFVMGFAPGAQVERAVAYASDRGLRDFAALIPKTPYGDLVREAFEASVRRHGDRIVALATYDPEQQDSDRAIKELAAPRRDPAQALFLPEGGDDINLITGQAAAQGLSGPSVRLIGTGLWDVPDLGRGIPATVGGWYAAPDPRARQNFVGAYAQTYGREPPRLATLAYDATALAATLAKRGGRFDRAALTNPNGFAGVDGIFRLTGRGLVERGLAVLEVTPDGARVVDPAPTTFARRLR